MKVSRILNVIYKYKIQIVLNYFLKIVLFFCKQKNIIVIESHNDFDCNGGAYFKYLIEHNCNKKYKIVWLLKNHENIDLKYDNVEYMQMYKPSLKKAYYLNMAKFLFADAVITKKMKKNQVSFFMNHGVFCLKDLKKVMTIDDSVDYLWSPSPFFDNVISKQLNIQNAHLSFLHFGYPFNDCLFTNTEKEINKIISKNYKKIFLWMPTFRKHKNETRVDCQEQNLYGIPLINNEEDLNTLNQIFAKHDSLLIIKYHPMQDLTNYKNAKQSNIITLDAYAVKEQKIDCYNLFKDVDCLLTDYSSVAYSFLLLNKPIAHILDETESYKMLLEDYEKFLLGPQIKSLTDMICFINDVINNCDNYKDLREQKLHETYEYIDGDSSKRIYEFMESLNEQN